MRLPVTVVGRRGRQGPLGVTRPGALFALLLVGCGNVARVFPASDAGSVDGRMAPRDARPGYVQVHVGDTGASTDTGGDSPKAQVPTPLSRDGGAAREASCPSEEAGASACKVDTITSCDPLTPCACGGCCVAGICAPQGAA